VRVSARCRDRVTFDRMAVTIEPTAA
jgi:hypothetical protein